MQNENESRGFEQFIGEEIVRVDSSSINVVHFYTKSGKRISVDAEERHYGIPVVSVNPESES